MSHSFEGVAEAIPTEELYAMPEPEQATQEASHLGQIASRIGQVVARTALALGLATGGLATVEVSRPESASAAVETGGYPDWNKPCVAGDPNDPNSSYGKTNGTGYWCSGYSWGDSPNKQNSSRGFGYRNCTDYVAWAVESQTDLDLGGLSHATKWDNGAAAKGLRVRGQAESPRVGDIAHWEGNDADPKKNYGHVAMVIKTSPLTVAEYNGGRDGSYGTRENPSGIDHYIEVPGLSGGGESGGSSAGDTDTIGSFDPSTATFYLKDSNSPGSPNVFFQYGAAGWKPVKGDWDGNGTDTIGIVDPRTQTFHLRNSNTGGSADAGTVQFGAGSWEPLVGNWDGIGSDGIGSYDPINSMFYLKNVITPGSPNVFFQYGATGDIPVVGDWDGNGTDTIGVFRPSTGTFYLRNSNTGGNANYTFQYGAAGWRPITGDWNGDGTDTIGIYDPTSATYHLRNSNSGGSADANVVQFGRGGWLPIVGDWNGR